MRRFLVMFKEFLIDTDSVKSGQNSPEVITACRCVNVGLFVSGNLRRDVIMSFAIGFEEDLSIVSFPGDSLRRVSPDERSISFFLLKAIEEAQGLEKGETITLDNGIEMMRASLDELNALWGSEVTQVPSTSPERFILDANLAADRTENNP